MTPRADYHVHTTFCDGENTPEEMVLAALRKGMTAIGFSGHSPLRQGGEDWCMTEAGAVAYRTEIARLKAKYAGQIRIFCGVEQDLCSETPTDGYDYAIGSVHLLRFGDAWVSVDASAQEQAEGVRRCCGGDYYAFCEAYYRAVAQVVRATACDLIGHFDLVAKFNEGNRFFDERHPRYVAAWQRAADALLQSGRPFELNTGAISRGYRREPYPSDAIRSYLADRGAVFVPSGDAHSAAGLCFGFDRLPAGLKIAELFGSGKKE